jgi:hypothetical protein
MVIDDQDPGVIWLLRGCPRRWFAPGQSIVVEDAPTYYGKMALRSSADENSIVIDVDPPSGDNPVELRVVIRNPLEKAPLQVTVNGVESRLDNGVVSLTNVRAHQQIVCRF